MKNILIYIDVKERFLFFHKLSKYLKNKYNIIFITNKYDLYKKLIKSKEKCFLITKENKKVEKLKIDKLLNNSLSILNKYHNINQAQEIFSYMQYILNNIYEKYPLSYIFIWNGNTTINRSLIYFANQKKIEKRVFEITNLEGKIFVDSKGINSSSFLFENIDLLDKYPSENLENKWKQWKKKFLKEKRIIHQSKNISKITIIDHLLNYYGYKYKNLLQEDYRNPFKILINKFKLKFIKNIGKTLNLEKEKYIFLALQTTDDSQLKINSNIDNIEAINIVLKKLKSSEKLFIKLHPSEKNIKFIKRIKEISKNNKIELVNNNTKELIENSKEVYVINSTVGLESLIYEKKIITLEDTIYNRCNRDQLKKYILYHMININYFNTKDDYDIKEIQKIFTINSKGD